MNRMLGLTLGVAALSLSVLTAGTGADRHRTFDQKMEKVDLSDLRDGETRTIGRGETAIVATRKGDQVTMEFSGHDGEKKSVKCEIGKSSCYVMTTDGEGKGQVVVVNKSGDGGKQIEKIVLQEGNGDESKVMVFAGHGDGESMVVDALPGGMSWVTSSDGKGAKGVKVIKIQGDGGTVLECPEGDATLMLKKGEEKSGPYFCPKHNLKMEAAKLPIFMKKIEVSTDSHDDEESD
jgi:hypothetical protein